MPRKPPLKQDTARVYAFLQQYKRDYNGMAPSLREIAKACYISPSQVLTHLEILEAHGIIARAPGRARALWLLDGEDER